MHRIVEIMPYDESWPKKFDVEAAKIQEILGANCIDVHHIGSTSVSGLSAKPVIDIMPVVKDINRVNIAGLESLGYKNKGELGMPFRIYMSKGSPQHTHHLHIWEIGNPEIEKHLLFRNYLINNSTAREQYADLKLSLAQQYKDAHRTYTTLKDDFIKDLVFKTGFDGLTVVQPLHTNEWQEYHRITKQQIFDLLPHIKYDPNYPTLTDPNHYHFILMKGIKVVAVAEIQMFDEETAALRILATDPPHQGHGYRTYFLNLLERWVVQHGKTKILMHAARRAARFYRKQGYVEMEFNDQGISDDHVDLGKLLNN